MEGVIVSDTGPINYLAVVGLIDLLPRMFTRIVIPPAVWDELSKPGSPGAVKTLVATRPSWIEVQHVAAAGLRDRNRGEAEAIDLARLRGATLLLTDDRKAMRSARELGIRITGNFGHLGPRRSTWPD